MVYQVNEILQGAPDIGDRIPESLRTYVRQGKWNPLVDKICKSLNRILDLNVVELKQNYIDDVLAIQKFLPNELIYDKNELEKFEIDFNKYDIYNNQQQRLVKLLHQLLFFKSFITDEKKGMIAKTYPDDRWVVSRQYVDFIVDILNVSTKAIQSNIDEISRLKPCPDNTISSLKTRLEKYKKG